MQKAKSRSYEQRPGQSHEFQAQHINLFLLKAGHATVPNFNKYEGSLLRNEQRILRKQKKMEKMS